MIILSSLSFAQIGNVGKPINFPAGGIKNNLNTSIMTIMTDEPTVKLNYDGSKLTAQISFKLLKPTTFAKIFYGVMEPDNHRPMPRFRSSITAKPNAAPDTLTYSATINVTSFMSGNDPLYTYKANGGGVFPFKIQVWSAEKNRLESWNRRFAFKNNAQVPCITEGPFITLVGKDNATIWFDTDMPTEGRVVTAISGTFKSTNGTHHEIQLTGLPSGTKISYHVETGDATNFSSSAQMSFKTQGTVNYFKFAHFSDSREGVEGGLENNYGVNTLALRQIGLAALSKGAEFVLFAGDLANGYSSDSIDQKMQYRSWKHSIEPFAGSMQMIPTMGNHEWFIDYYYDSTAKIAISVDKTQPHDAQSNFSNNFVLPKNGSGPETSGPPYGETSYYYDYQNIRFISVNDDYWWDSNAEQYGAYPNGYIGDVQFAWIKKTIEEAQANPNIDHILLGWHEPPFPCGGHVEDAMWYYGGDKSKNGGIDRSYIVNRRDSLWAMFSNNNKVLAVLNGHEHNYSRLKIDNSTPVHLDNTSNSKFVNPIWQIISGGCGAPYYNIDPTVPWAKNVSLFSIQSNFVLYTVNGKKVTLETYSINGELIDTCTLRDGKTVMSAEDLHIPDLMFSLSPEVYPNPAINSVSIDYSIPYDDKVTLVIFDNNGNEMAKLINNTGQSAGPHKFIWDTTGIQSGIYYCRLMSSGNIATNKIVITK